MKFIDTTFERSVFNSIMSYLPSFYEDSKIVNEMVRVDAEELEELYKQIGAVLNQRFIKTADTSLDRWGKEFNIDLSPYIEEKWSIENDIFDFSGKVAGNVVPNPHRFRTRSGNLTTVPTVEADYTDVSQLSYDQLSSQDTVISNQTTNVVGAYISQLYEFDFSHLGLTLTQMKDQLRKFTFTIRGWGEGDNAGVATNGLTGRIWNGNTNQWDTLGNIITAGALTTYSITPVIMAERLTTSQKIYVAVNSTYPASATNASSVSVDYVKLDAEYDWVEYIEYARSFDEKRALLMLQLRSLGTITKKLLKEMCQIYDGGETEIIENNANHEITIKFMSVFGIPLKIRDLTIALRNILPSHLNFKYEYRYMTWDEVGVANNTWVTIDSKDLLWSEVDNGGLR